MRAAVARADKESHRASALAVVPPAAIAAVANSLLRLKGETAPVLGAAPEAGDARVPRRPRPLTSLDEAPEETPALDPADSDPASETLDALSEAVRAETAAGAVKVVADTYAALKAHAPARDPTNSDGRYVSRRFERRSQLVVLCRSNASVFEAAEMIHGFPGATLGVVGGTQSLRLEQLMDVPPGDVRVRGGPPRDFRCTRMFAKKELAFLRGAEESAGRAIAWES